MNAIAWLYFSHPSQTVPCSQKWLHYFEIKAFLFRGKTKDPGKPVGMREIQARIPLLHSGIDENKRCIRVVTGVGAFPFKKELVPLLNCYPCNIKRFFLFDIFIMIKEGGRIAWWAARVRQMSLTLCRYIQKFQKLHHENENLKWNEKQQIQNHEGCEPENSCDPNLLWSAIVIFNGNGLIYI